MSCLAAEHLHRAERLLRRLGEAQPRSLVADQPETLIAIFKAALDQLELGMQSAEEDGAPAEVHRALEALCDMAREIGAAGVAAGVIERARLAK
jgi:hypothetical protein